jgi:hypothetical protein
VLRDCYCEFEQVLGKGCADDEEALIDFGYVFGDVELDAHERQFQERQGCLC